jgi:DNA ligase-1
LRQFAALYAALDASTATTAKVDGLKSYFAIADAADAAWAVYFLAGGKPRQVVPTGVLRELACARAGIDDWLFDECYQAVGDLAETIAHVLPAPSKRSDLGLAVWIEQRLLPLRDETPQTQAARIASYWEELDPDERFLLTKLIGGGFRVGVSGCALCGGSSLRVVALLLLVHQASMPTCLRTLVLTSSSRRKEPPCPYRNYNFAPV